MATFLDLIPQRSSAIQTCHQWPVKAIFLPTSNTPYSPLDASATMGVQPSSQSMMSQSNTKASKSQLDIEIAHLAFRNFQSEQLLPPQNCTATQPITFTKP